MQEGSTAQSMNQPSLHLQKVLKGYLAYVGPSRDYAVMCFCRRKALALLAQHADDGEGVGDLWSGIGFGGFLTSWVGPWDIQYFP